MSASEGQLQAAFLLAAPRELPHLRLFRRNVGAARMHRRQRDRFDLTPAQVVRFGIAGQCDLYALVRGGRHIEIELKAAGGRLSPDQRRWEAWCAAWGVPHLVLGAKPDETIDQTVSRWCERLRHRDG